MVRKLWRAFWRRAPRTLKFTRVGKAILAMAFASGFAAINTGNNLLFLGWGMVLSAIIFSGVLSEATLRFIAVEAEMPRFVRAGDPASLPMQLSNTSSRFPLFGVEVVADFRGPKEMPPVMAPFLLRLEPDQSRDTIARFVAPARGAYSVRALRAVTEFPFGFFEKSRRFPAGDTFWAAPRRVDVSNIEVQLISRLGWTPAQRVGRGEDFFSLRPFREGDDPRRIHWRRSARTGRWVVRENEAMDARTVILETGFGRRGDESYDDIELTIATVGSLAEGLLDRGYSVGLRGPGTWVRPDLGPTQTWSVLDALARMNPDDPMTRARSAAGVVRLAVVLKGAHADPQADGVVLVGEKIPAFVEAQEEAEGAA